jgi:hypothetical protein
MIKIEIDDIEKKKNEYLKRSKVLITNRIQMLLTSLCHLNGEPIDIKSDGIKSWTAITFNLLKNLDLGIVLKRSKFNKPTYSSQIQNLLADSVITGKLQTSGIHIAIKFLKELLASNQGKLEDLLVCPPELLSTKNSDLLKRHKLNTINGHIILRQAFNYNKFTEVGQSIRSFFRTPDFPAFCPYCNLEETEHIERPDGKSASGHELDHFFSQTDHPLLSYSFFNLIPSCGKCNKTNKKDIPFSDEFHLNPYIRGFNKEMVYEPLLKGEQVFGIRIFIHAAKSSEIRRQLFGSSEQIYEVNDGTKKNEEGNINVFALDSRYKSPNRIKKAGFVLQDLDKMNRGKKFNQKLFDLLNDVDLKKVHEQWYEETMRTPFNPEDFNKEAFSKFNRDIHDYYYNKLFEFNQKSS